MRKRTNFRRIHPGRSARIALVALLAAVLLAGPAGADGLWPKVFDVCVLRTTGVLQTGVGALFFLPTAFFTGAIPAIFARPEEGKANVDEAWDVFVYDPYERAILRPLGAF
jgi:hypothetical protein